MALIFLQTKQETKVNTPVVTEVSTEVEKLVDHYITLKNIYDSQDTKTLLEEMEKAKKKLQLIANENFDAEEPAVLSGTLGEVVFSPNAKPLEITDPYALFSKIFETFGLEVAFNVVKFGVTELKKVLSEAELEPYTKKGVGARTLKAVVEKE